MAGQVTETINCAGGSLTAQVSAFENRPFGSARHVAQPSLDGETGCRLACAARSGDRNRSCGSAGRNGGPDVIGAAAVRARGGDAVERHRGLDQIVAPDANLVARLAFGRREAEGLRGRVGETDIEREDWPDWDSCC